MMTIGKCLTRFMKQTAWRSWLLAVVLSLLFFTIAFASSGDLDTTFSSDGLETTHFGPPKFTEYANALAIQSDGGIVVVGGRYNPANPHTASRNFALARYSPDGTLDTSFNGTGKLLENFGAEEGAYDVAIQSNERIVVVGYRLGTETDLAVARYKKDGTLDTTFGTTGKFIIRDGVGVDNYGQAVAIQSDGKIVIAGVRGSGTSTDFAVYRLNTDGSLDTTFSGDGRLAIDFGAADAATVVALQSDGKIVVSGYSGTTLAFDFAVARLSTDGNLDTTFSGDGKETTDFSGDELGNGLAIQADGKIVMSGYKCPLASPCDAVLARYNTDGSLDTSFNSNGKQTIDDGSGVDNGALDVVVQSDGKIVVPGFSTNSSNDRDFVIYRLNTDGSLDTTFGTNGKVMIDFGLDQGEDASEIAIDEDGNYVLAGSTYDSPHSDFAVARVLP